MQKFNYVITNPQGIHARPAGLLVKEAQKYENCNISILKDGKQVDAKKLLQVMSLGIKCGNTIEVIVEGGEQEQVASAFKEFLKNNS
ncbi:MAG: HPr family phosphocarrier protein [Lachnotalea sp.]